MKTQVLNYDPAEYDFRGIIAEYLGTENLDGLTANYEDDQDLAGNSLYKNMELSPVFRKLYAGLNGAEGDKFYDLYRRFVAEVVRPQFDEPIYFQAKPSHRILFADVPGQSRFHRDGDYGHAPGEVNFQVVQTPAYGYNAMWIESEVGKEDYQPLELEVGQYGKFRGVELSHGAKANTTGKSRVSFDFRVIPESQAPARYRQGPKPGTEGNPVRDNALSFVRCD